MTANKREYKKQIARIKRFMRNAEKRGFIFEEQLDELQMPKRVTQKALNRIKEIKPKDLYRNARHVDFETGEIKTANQELRRRRSESAKRAALTRANKSKGITSSANIPSISIAPKAIDYVQIVRRQIEELERKVRPELSIDTRKNELLAILDDNETYYSENEGEYANYLKSKEQEIAPCLHAIEYDSDPGVVNWNFIHLARLLNRGTLSADQSERMTEYYDRVDAY